MELFPSIEQANPRPPKLGFDDFTKQVMMTSHDKNAPKQNRPRHRDSSVLQWAQAYALLMLLQS